ncbi:MAG: head GIN domain-containing protein [Paracoccaceae bacterium]
MKITKTTTAAFLAGATTLAVSLPAFSQEREYDLTGFNSVDVSAGLSVELEIGPDFEVVAEASNNRTLKQLDITVRGDKLIVSRDSGWLDFSLFSARRDATIRITLPDLTAIQASSGADVFVTGDYGDSLRASTSSGAELDLENVSGQSLRFKASSGSELRAQGECGALDVSSSSGASIRVDELSCNVVDATASSGSDIRAFASKSAVAHASSGGGVRITGSPEQIERSESSGGSVKVN